MNLHRNLWGISTLTTKRQLLYLKVFRTILLDLEDSSLCLQVPLKQVTNLSDPAPKRQLKNTLPTTGRNLSPLLRKLLLRRIYSPKNLAPKCLRMTPTLLLKDKTPFTFLTMSPISSTLFNASLTAPMT